MQTNEKTTTTVRIFESTSKLIQKYRGNKSAGVFVAEAVKFYIAHQIDNGDELYRIRTALEEMKQTEQTNLGLLCEVLRQAGILNGNGEISFKKES